MKREKKLPIERVFLGITGASGSLYAERLLQILLAHNVRTYVCFSQAAKSVVATELPEGLLPHLAKVQKRKGFGQDKDILVIGSQLGLSDSNLDELRVFDNGDLYAPVASGSEGATHTVICPASMGTLGRIAHGMSGCLIERAADVALKERRPLILVPRETPLNLIHLENMVILSKAGGNILPAMPAFYFKPKSVLDIIDFIVERIISSLNLTIDHKKKVRWNPISL